MKTRNPAKRTPQQAGASPPVAPWSRRVAPGAGLALALLASMLLASGSWAQERTRVKAGQLADLAIYPRQSAPATVISLNSARLSAQIKARIDEIAVRTGDVAEAGQVLARLDCADYRLAARQAEARVASLKARLELAERRLARARKLVERQTVSEELVDEREADLAVLRGDRGGALAQLEKAKLDVSRCAIRSPYRAVVIARVGAVGEFADVGANLLEVLDLERLEVSAQVPARDIEQVKTLPDLRFEDSTGQRAVKLRVVLPTVNTQTRNREARLLFVAAPALPGAAGKLVWRDHRPHVPAKLLARREAGFGVFLYDNGKARFHLIPGAQQGRPTPVALPPDARLVTEGHYGLQDGQAIAIVP